MQRMPINMKAERPYTRKAFKRREIFIMALSLFEPNSEVHNMASM